MKIIDVKDIVRINNYLTKNSDFPQRIGGIYTSLLYYNDIYSCISSVFRALIKNHYFIDGNKRTAFLILQFLCKYNNIKCRVSVNDIVDIASKDYNISEISKKIF